jgi:protocatechuate 3,4-dioxygenase beta subunit
MLALLILLPSAASAQTYRASVRGTVTDPNGAAIPGAEIRVINEATGETRVVSSDSNGEYAVASLVAGEYRMTVAATGFMTYPHELSL